jgi:hypothetical protein
MRARHSALEWAMLAGLTAMWGSSFVVIKLGLATLPPATLDRKSVV